MTNETMLVKLTEMSNCLNEVSIRSYLENLIKEVKTDICEEGWKSSGKRGVYAAANRISVDGQKYGLSGWYNTTEKNMAGDMENVTYVGDANRYICFYDTLTFPDKDYGIEKRKLDYSKVTERAFSVLEWNNTVNIPYAHEVKSAIKIHKSTHKNSGKNDHLIWQLKDAQDHTIYVNANYLLDALEALPEPECYAYPIGGGHYALYFKGENGHGALYPVNPKFTTTDFILNASVEVINNE